MMIDTLPEKHRIRDVAARGWLEQLKEADPGERIAIFIQMAGINGMTQAEIAARTGASDDQISSITRELIQTRRVFEVTASPLILLSGESYHALATRLMEMLAEHHRREPLSLGLSREEVRERLFGQVASRDFSRSRSAPR